MNLASVLFVIGGAMFGFAIGIMMTRSKWEYGKMDDKIARRDRASGAVQFIMWHEGYVVGQTADRCDFIYPEDWWINFDSTHWPKFKPYQDHNFDQRSGFTRAQ